MELYCQRNFETDLYTDYWLRSETSLFLQKAGCESCVAPKKGIFPNPSPDVIEENNKHIKNLADQEETEKEMNRRSFQKLIHSIIKDVPHFQIKEFSPYLLCGIPSCGPVMAVCLRSSFFTNGRFYCSFPECTIAFCVCGEEGR